MLRRKSSACVIGLALLFSACGMTVQEPKPQLPCADIRNIDTILKPNTPQILVFGEVHGSQETPDFMKNVVCHAINTGRPTVFVIEFSPSNFAPVEQFLYSDAPNAREDLLRHSYWMSGNQDGKRSIAMFNMIEDTKLYAQDFPHFKMAGYDQEHDDSISNRDLSSDQQTNARAIVMSNNLITLAHDNPEAKIIVLTGNFHSGRYGQPRKADINSSGNMISYLPRDLYWSFNMNAPRGTVWLWMSSVTPSIANIDPSFIVDGKPIKDRAITLFDDRSARYHDGAFFIQSKTASRPTYE